MGELGQEKELLLYGVSGGAAGIQEVADRNEPLQAGGPGTGVSGRDTQGRREGGGGGGFGAQGEILTRSGKGFGR